MAEARTSSFCLATFSKCRNTMERFALSVPWASNLGLAGGRE